MPSQSAALAEPGDESAVIVVGAGASGLAAAILLARAGKAVTVYERMTDVDQPYELSYPIVVNPRGMKVLKAIDPSLEKEIDVATGMVAGWSIMGPKKEIARMKSGTVLGTTRGAVVSALFRHAEAQAGVTLRLGARLVRADALEETLTFELPGGDEECVSYASARVIDGSGCFSKLRGAVAAVDPTFEVEAWPWELTFRNLFTAEKPASRLDDRLHYIFTTAGIYAAVLKGSRWVFSLSANPALGEAEWMRAEAPTPELVARLKAHVAEHCPPAAEMLDDAEYSRFFERRAFGGQVVRLNRLVCAERVAFVGDAAHSVIPSTGEGINAALEDVGVLVHALASAPPGRWFDAYNAARLDDARALSEYAAWMLDGMKAEAAERNRRTAAMVLEAIGQKVGLLGPSWSDLSFGKLAARMEPYAKILGEWKAHMKKVAPLGNAIVYLPNRKHRRAAREAARAAAAAGA